MPIEKDFPLIRIDFEELRAKNPNRIETDEAWARELGLKQQEDDWDWGKEIPIIFVFEKDEEKKYAPASGVHRLLGRYFTGFETYPKVDVRTGTKEDFVRAAIASNKDDNERKALSREDKRKVLTEIFESLEFWSKSPDTIVRLTGFARSFVFSFRKEFLSKLRETDPKKAAFLETIYENSKKTKTVTRGKQTYVMDASNLGSTPRTTKEANDETEVEVEVSELDKLIKELAAKEGVTVKEFLSPEYWIPRYARFVDLKPEIEEEECEKPEIGIEAPCIAIAQVEKIVYSDAPQLFSIKNEPGNEVRIEPGDVLIVKEGRLFFDLYDNGNPVALEKVVAS